MEQVSQWGITIFKQTHKELLYALYVGLGAKMTHDELLAKIDDILEGKCETPYSVCGECRSIQALRAVVELHKPDIQGRCDICTWIIGKPGYVLYEVCPTIQAIEKELNPTE
jgi:hypothetical protein